MSPPQTSVVGRDDSYTQDQNIPVLNVSSTVYILPQHMTKYVKLSAAEAECVALGEKREGGCNYAQGAIVYLPRAEWIVCPDFLR